MAKTRSKSNKKRDKNEPQIMNRQKNKRNSQKIEAGKKNVTKKKIPQNKNQRRASLSQKNYKKQKKINKAPKLRQIQKVKLPVSKIPRLRAKKRYFKPIISNVITKTRRKTPKYISLKNKRDKQQNLSIENVPKQQKQIKKKLVRQKKKSPSLQNEEQGTNNIQDIKISNPDVQVEIDVQQVQKQLAITKVDQMNRIARSKVQKIFLIKAKREGCEWSFVVMGTRGSHYNVMISTQIRCSCFDFRFKKKACKHIYFIVTQVAQNDQILQQFKEKPKLTEAALHQLDEQLVNRLKPRMQNQSQITKDDLKEYTDCTICFCQMNVESEKLYGCKTCNKYFHLQCLSAWKLYTNTCPLCRTILPKQSINALARLQEVNV